MNEPVAPSVKKLAHALIDELPDSATWDQVVYEFAVRRAIERGLAEAQQGLTVDIDEVRRELLPPE